ncbi:hypothetical protein ACVIW2_005924 [Bradyrhizobium huanghuaihaiense]
MSVDNDWEDDETHPLAYWRSFAAEMFNPKRRREVRDSVQMICSTSDELDAAIQGDSTAAMAIAARLRMPREVNLRLDITMTLLASAAFTNADAAGLMADWCNALRLSPWTAPGCLRAGAFTRSGAKAWSAMPFGAAARAAPRAHRDVAAMSHRQRSADDAATREGEIATVPLSTRLPNWPALRAAAVRTKSVSDMWRARERGRGLGTKAFRSVRRGLPLYACETDTITFLVVRLLTQNEAGTGVSGITSFPGHDIRHIIATGTLKQAVADKAPDRWHLAADAIHDGVRTVKVYVQYLPRDRQDTLLALLRRGPIDG